ncbi:urea ABC transporter ATP-binding subunit UrtE [Aestuariivirga litoralis]|uniref:urea ABC transporter ATP-binding subunit UrtE n=1 Tax=Aestuariivirga litoralis TaxID=2650924 RepID=UPI0018C5AF13|nr:urea ABC transporter ATP-binding subunit UrtE [Aestuariivirga litoralis]MBG1230904.1 urea ABC transporter ATP-binding subunit UrtE [Aestuariivirga litoralis]
MLEAKSVNLFYGASQALKDVSVSASPGKITCILGRNGTGKTSLIRAIAGQAAARGGSIMFDGKDITKLPADKRARAGIALVPQGREIFSSLTVEENLKTGFAGLARKERNIPDEIYELFPVLKSMLHRRGGDLSGGQQQQLAIGRALVMRPKVLLLDEPTEGIQPSIIKDIERVIAMLRDRGTMSIILVEQYFDFARRLADNFIILNRGRVIHSGDGAALQDEKARTMVMV